MSAKTNSTCTHAPTVDPATIPSTHNTIKITAMVQNKRSPSDRGNVGTGAPTAKWTCSRTEVFSGFQWVHVRSGCGAHPLYAGARNRWHAAC